MIYYTVVIKKIFIFSIDYIVFLYYHYLYMIQKRTMDKKDNGLERLVKIYLNLTDEEKEKIILLGEGLLKSQKIIVEKNPVSDNKGKHQ